MLSQSVLNGKLLKLIAVDLAIDATVNFDLKDAVNLVGRAIKVLGDLKVLDQLVLNFSTRLDGVSLHQFRLEPLLIEAH